LQLGQLILLDPQIVVVGALEHDRRLDRRAAAPLSLNLAPGALPLAVLARRQLRKLLQALQTGLAVTANPMMMMMIIM
jgi:hypothetical protein